MGKILIVEDSRTLAELVRTRLRLDTGFDVLVAENYIAAKQALEKNDFFAAVSDLNLPDAARGAMVELLIKKKIPVIVYTGDYSDELRERIWKKRIVDYVLKRDPGSDGYISRMVCQLYKNRDIDILIVDDSAVLRNSMKKLLDSHLFRVHTCSNARDALDLADTLPKLKLIITDYMMPDMDGFEFVRAIRKKYSKDKLAVIGVSGVQSEQISAKFLKFGANDFMNKKFSHEQFYTRVNQNLQNILMIEDIKELSLKDYLTGLYNRRYFFAEMDAVYDPDGEKTVALLDIDHFKKVNDTHGHDAGDAVLIKVAELMQDYVGDSGFVTRFGGEEFCIYLGSTYAADYFEGLRQKIEEMNVRIGGRAISVTASFGVISEKGLSIDTMLTSADELLYTAKTSGRNKVCVKG